MTADTPKLRTWDSNDGLIKIDHQVISTHTCLEALLNGVPGWAIYIFDLICFRTTQYKFECCSFNGKMTMSFLLSYAATSDNSPFLKSFVLDQCTQWYKYLMRRYHHSRHCHSTWYGLNQPDAGNSSPALLSDLIYWVDRLSRWTQGILSCSSY